MNVIQSELEKVQWILSTDTLADGQRALEVFIIR